MTSSKILPTKQPGLPFSGPAGRRPSEEDTINSRQLIEQKWETLPRLIIPQRMITFLPPTRLFFFTLRNSIYRKIKKCTVLLLLHEILSDRADDVLPTAISATAATHWLSRFLPILSMATRSFTFTGKKIIHASRNPISISSCSENANTILMDVARNFFPFKLLRTFVTNSLDIL